MGVTWMSHVYHHDTWVLNMQDEAEELYKKSQRYDLLNQFYQALGQWSKVSVKQIIIIMLLRR